MYYGPFSDNSNELTPEDRDYLGHYDSNDGVFYMRLQDYFAFCQYTSVNFDTTGWHHAYHLTTDDDLSGAKTGEFGWCGPVCSRYTGRITNVSNTRTV